MEASCPYSPVYEETYLIECSQHNTRQASHMTVPIMQVLPCEIPSDLIIRLCNIEQTLIDLYNPHAFFTPCETPFHRPYQRHSDLTRTQKPVFFGPTSIHEDDAARVLTRSSHDCGFHEEGLDSGGDFQSCFRHVSQEAQGGTDDNACPLSDQGAERFGKIYVPAYQQSLLLLLYIPRTVPVYFIQFDVDWGSLFEKTKSSTITTPSVLQS
ncbi:hypothetical protein EDD37DRAFT_606028 [Exophiala viscosa]|uniref:uncharacterized protein n=1 Tax=Exophiala viscosa TaxID=2486360 RepID=UPI00218F3AA2|nr:hypothetical protein EDD37DRAFT_606028 [Exophiala viscosa]